MNKLPASFVKYANPKARLRRLMILISGDRNTGKSEFIMSAPGPGINFSPDLGYEGMLNNPTPPATRNDSIICVPHALLPNMATPNAEAFINSWNNFYNAYFETVDNPDSITSGLDGGTEQWEALRMGLWGRVEQIMQINYTGANSLLRAFVWRQFESKKNIIQTFKLKDEYADKVDPVSGEVKYDKAGKKERIATGDYIMDGPGKKFTEYLWQVQLLSLYNPGKTTTVIAGPRKGEVIKKPGEFGIRITDCKMQTELAGEELWGSDCNFQGLAKLIYPNTTMADWGY